MAEGITIHVLGDYGPFSRTGKSISYMVSVGSSNYLIDCGAPLFQHIGGYGLKDLTGLVITHCHDDHKRWFTDLALFHRYAPDLGYRIRLLASEEIHGQLARSSSPALERGLSPDSKMIVDIPFDAYVDHRLIGPRARYRITTTGYEGGVEKYAVVDESGKVLGPEAAKVVVGPKSGLPRMLLKDPEYREWVEPFSFYSFSSDFFYTVEKNVFRDEEGFTIETFNAPVWHGIAANGVKVSTGQETVIFSSDTMRDVEVWKALCTEKRATRLEMTRGEFESASMIVGDINNYIERTWSKERYEDAVGAFRDAVVVHDVAVRDAVVHTHYRNIEALGLGKEKLLLTHSPDRMTSEWALLRTGKSFRIVGGTFFEVVGEELFPMDGDVYHKEEGNYFVGYRNDRGSHVVVERDGVLGLTTGGGDRSKRRLYNVDLYQDIGGRYFPVLDEEGAHYSLRKDGLVEIVRVHERGSTGTLAEKELKRIPHSTGLR